MKIPSLLLLIASIFSLPLVAQETVNPSLKELVKTKTDTVKVAPTLNMLPTSDRVANYTINAKLNENGHYVTGDMSVNWKNYSNDTIQELQFHLYLNAFKNSQSTFFQEQTRGKNIEQQLRCYPEKWGYSKIISMQMKDAILTDSIHYIHPDDNNVNDQTVISVHLPKAVLPGQKIEVKINFESHLPSVIARTGFADDFHLVAQWFPKLGVYEPKGWRNAPKGQWNCHQFHAHSEFYSNFGTYNVNITAHKKFKIGASGKIVGKPQLKHNEQTHNFIAQDVIDFAWTASPKFIEKEETWEHVSIKLLLQPENVKLADRYFESAKAALSYLNAELGEYPYETLTIVDPSIKGREAGGMEYPNLITVGDFDTRSRTLRFLENSTFGLLGRPSKHIKRLEIVTVHEIAHQYFMGLLASNEFEEAWLDEGFTEYWETRIMDEYYGEGSYLDFRGLKIKDSEHVRSNYFKMRHPNIAPSYGNVWDFPGHDYVGLTYRKPATWLYTLGNMVGKETMSKIWKNYYAKWRFKHPTHTDFIAIANDIVLKDHGKKFGNNIYWFFQQFLYGTQICDYTVHSIVNGTPTAEVGIFEKDGGIPKTIEAPSVVNSDEIQSRIILQRLGDAILPVEVLVHFENGTEERLMWNGQNRTTTIWYNDKNSKVTWVKVDPDNKITLDANRINNVRSANPKKTPFLKYSLKMSFWFQNILEVFALFV